MSPHPVWIVWFTGRVAPVTTTLYWLGEGSPPARVRQKSDNRIFAAFPLEGGHSHLTASLRTSPHNSNII